MKIFKRVAAFGAGLSLLIGLAGPMSVSAFPNPLPVPLLTASSFAILAGTPNITDAGNSSTIIGNVGLSPAAGAGIALLCSQVYGTIYAVDATGQPCFAGNPPLSNKTIVDNAKLDLTAAYINAAGRVVNSTIPTELGGQVLTAGVYDSGSTTFQITAGAGPLILDGLGNPDSVFIFKMGFAGVGLTVGPGSVVTLQGGAQARNVFWQVDTATINTTATFKGNILALNSITAANASVIEGRLLARNGNVTLINNTVSVPTSLHLRKIVINDNGGVALNTAWTLTATGATVLPTNLSGTTPVDSGPIFKADTYALAESGGPSGYVASNWSCVKNAGAAVIGSSVTIAAGDEATCTITNDDTAAGGGGITNSAMLTVVKTVINDNGRTSIVSDFPLFVNGVPVASGSTNTFPTTGQSFTVSETNNGQYTSSFSGDCDATGHVTLFPGDTKACVITNNDIGAAVVVPPIPPLIDVVKVPNPLALPGGPGPVTYTYTLRNIGTVPVHSITMVGDTCSPINLISGDNNGDSILQVNETWIYRCSTTLSATHTNTVVATGVANGLTATDIASATVVVGVPIIPPLIHVTKIPSPLTLVAGGGIVTYTERITNPGTVALNNVTLNDDKCGPMQYVSGDTNGDSKLDTTETWIYVCQSNLTQTTTNTAIATGQANGLTVRDFAIATVVVGTAIPALPKTGFDPAVNVVAPAVAAVVLMVSFLFYANRKKETL